jgi:4a-hydroxytetrahydrobiopterin dehydratase
MDVLTDEQLNNVLYELNTAWSALPGQGLVRVFETGSFSEGVALLARVAELANRLDHHPEARLGFNQVELALMTRDAGGVTRKDVALAKAIDGLQL